MVEEMKTRWWIDAANHWMWCALQGRKVESAVDEENKGKDGYSSMSDDSDDDVDGDDTCETDGCREDLQLVGDRTKTKKRNRQLRHNSGKAKSGGEVDMEKRITGSGRQLATSSARSIWSECSGRSRHSLKKGKRLGVNRRKTTERSSAPRRSGMDASQSSADPCRQTSGCCLECSDSKLMCDVDPQFLKSWLIVSKQAYDSAVSGRLREKRVRPKCPFGFASLSSIGSLSTNDEAQKPDSRAYHPQNHRHSTLCDFICSFEKASESNRRFTQSSCRDSVQQNSPACTSAAGGSEIPAGESSTCGLMTNSSNNTFADSPALRQRRRHSRTPDQSQSGSAAKTARGITSTTNRPRKVFNSADVADLSPNCDVFDSHQSSTDELARSFISADVPDSPLVGGSRSSRLPSTDRPAGSFDMTDLVESPSVGFSCSDSRRRVAAGTPAGQHFKDGGPSAVSRRPLHFYSDCVECPRCLNYAVCDVCNIMHEPRHDVDECLPARSDLSDDGYLTSNDVSDPAARGCYSSYSAELGSSDTGSVDESRRLEGPPGACSIQSMDLHTFIDRDRARPEGRRGWSRAPARRRSCSPRHREEGQSTMHSNSACTRLRSLHFYTDCADCPECCSSALCGSCCSVHGPLEEPADISPRCAKRLPGNLSSRPVADVCDRIGRRSKTEENLENLCGDTHFLELQCDDDAETRKPKRCSKDVLCAPDDPPSPTKGSNIDNTSIVTPDNFDVISSVIPDMIDASTVSPQGLPVHSDDVVSDEDCWTFVEKATCGVLALLIFIIIVAIYLQLSRRYFTGV